MDFAFCTPSVLYLGKGRLAEKFHFRSEKLAERLEMSQFFDKSPEDSEKISSRFRIGAPSA
jgi:hypothetical protein